MPIATIREFLKLEASAGIVLVISAGLALVMANTFLAPFYQVFLDVPVIVQVGALKLAKPLLLWVNDGLMAIFFFLVGLEIKREVLQGELSSWSQASLPGFAALGGMAIPALIYVLINLGSPETLRGWAIPAATDIAFALGVLALLGSRVPAALKIFLLALAIMDDLGAIIIIAVFYTADLSLTSLGLAAVGIVILACLNIFRVTRLASYILVGLAVWICVLKSGVHATLAGVAVAFFIPLRGASETDESPLEHLSLLAPVPLGIAAGLFIGKQIGVFGFSYGAVRLGLAKLPQGVSWLQVYGLSFLTGIGFTMSLFIGTLAFDDLEHATGVRLGVLLGSLLSGVGGYFLLRFTSSPPRRGSFEAELQQSEAESAGAQDSRPLIP
jgi:NhaA family Na+:H+ antiporter